MVLLAHYGIVHATYSHAHNGIRTTMYTEYNVLKCHGDAEDFPLPSFKYNHFRMSWYSFLGLLDIDYDHGFIYSIHVMFVVSSLSLSSWMGLLYPLEGLWTHGKIF